MKTVTASRFKAQALAMLDDVANSGEDLLITKRGKPIARVTPYRAPDMTAQPGWLAGTLQHLGDIVSPLGADEWEAAS